MVANEGLRSRLAAAVAAHDTLKHPYYQAWSMGRLTLGDLRAYAAQYLHQIEALPGLIAAAALNTKDTETRVALERNLAEEEGRLAATVGDACSHRELWLRFGQALGATREALSAQAAPETRAAAESLRAIAAEGDVEALASLWAYEAQTARVAAEKRRGLAEQYGVTDARALQFFALHETLDVHHAEDLLAAVDRACAKAGKGAVERACAAATRSARAQWQFLDGVERTRTALAA